MFPSFSHSQLAAKTPIKDEINLDLLEIIESVEYANNASPAPTGSTALL